LQDFSRFLLGFSRFSEVSEIDCEACFALRTAPAAQQARCPLRAEMQKQFRKLQGLRRGRWIARRVGETGWNLLQSPT